MESEEKPTSKFIRDAILAVLGGFLIDPTLKALHLDVSPYLRHVWYGIAVFLTLDALKRSRHLSSRLIAFRSSLTGRQRMIAYIVVAVIGAGCSLFYWWGLGRVFGKETGLTEKTAEVKVDAYIQPGSSNPYPPGTKLGGIVWGDNYVDVRLDIAVGAIAIQNLDFEVALDTSIAGIGANQPICWRNLFCGWTANAISVTGKHRCKGKTDNCSHSSDTRLSTNCRKLQSSLRCSLQQYCSAFGDCLCGVKSSHSRQASESAVCS